ncbi:MAG TPA: DUF3185 family protein [Alphaproteobacteria bacterium]|nr:DUF3185 family protein [Alphaproteobacteria bacterium]
MSVTRLLGLGIAAVGIFFLVVGIDSTHAPLEQLSQTFTGKFTHETMLYIAGGIAAIVAGGVLAVVQPR